MLFSFLAADPDVLTQEMEAANQAIGINEACNVVAPRQTGNIDLDSLEAAAALASSSIGGIKGEIMATGLPALVTIEQSDENAAVVIHARRARRDAQGVTFLEVAFMHNTKKTFQSPGSLDLLALQALREEVGDIRKVVCSSAELRELFRELKSNSAQLSVACHVRNREAFACGKTGEEAVHNRVVREPLEISFLKLSKPRSSALAAALEAKVKGNSKFSAGLLDEALVLYEQVVKGFKECPEHGSGEAWEEQGKVEANRAECFLRQEKWHDAVKAASAAVEIDGKNVKALFRRAKAYKSLADVDAAVVDLKAAIRTDPTNQPAHMLLKELHAGKSAPKCSPDAKGSPRKPQKPDTAASAAGALAGSLPKPSAWASGLSPALQREWLVDCYRMRVDDDYAWGGGKLRGLYAASCGDGGDVALDFLTFCKLAVRKNVVPKGWDWAAFLQTAKGLLRFAFEKSDAQEKYGNENVFAIATGGRSLRYTGEVVYGSSVMSMEESSDMEDMEDEVQQQKGQEKVFMDVGGVAAWKEAGLIPRGFSARASKKGVGKSKGAKDSARG